MIDFESIVSDFCSVHHLQIVLSTDMPCGYESANGTFDIAKNTLFLNRTVLASAPDYEALFYLFHELRHVLQYTRPQLFSKAIQYSLNYVLMYDGSCFKLVHNDWLECRLEGSAQYLSDAYFGQLYEMDANSYAYEQVQKRCGTSQKLDELYSFWIPVHGLSDAEYMELYKTIDSQIEQSGR